MNKQIISSQEFTRLNVLNVAHLSAHFDILKNIACVAHKTATLLHLYP